MIESILIKAIDIVFEDAVKNGDIYIENGKIIDIGPYLNYSAEKEINGKGLTALPGVIDPHVHFREPGAEWKETIYSGSKAAVSGGVTSFFDMPNTKPSCITEKTIQQKKEIASASSLINYNFFIGATHTNLEELNKTENIPGIKIFMGSSTGNLLVDDMESLTSIFSTGSRLIAIHSEDEPTIKKNEERTDLPDNVFAHNMIRTPEAAVKCTNKATQLALKHNRRLHICHVTTKDEVDILRNLRTGLSDEKKYLITGEVSPQHIFLHLPDIYDNLGTFGQINPPLRHVEHCLGLWEGLKDSTLSFIGTDHAPHTVDEKKKPYGEAPSGMPGVETSLPLLLNQVDKGNCTLQDISNWMSGNQALLYNIQNKGFLKVGYDADIVLVDTKKKKKISNETVVSKCGWTAFDGTECTGWPVATIVNGQVVFREGDFFEDIKGKEIQILDF